MQVKDRWVNTKMLLYFIDRYFTAFLCAGNLSLKQSLVGASYKYAQSCILFK